MAAKKSDVPGDSLSSARVPLVFRLPWPLALPGPCWGVAKSGWWGTLPSPWADSRLPCKGVVGTASDARPWGTLLPASVALVERGRSKCVGSPLFDEAAEALLAVLLAASTRVATETTGVDTADVGVVGPKRRAADCNNSRQ